MARLMFNWKRYASVTNTSDDANFVTVSHYDENRLIVKDSKSSNAIMLVPRSSSMNYNVPEPSDFVWFCDDFNRPYRALIHMKHPFDKGDVGVVGISSGSGVYSPNDTVGNVVVASCIYAGKGWEEIRDRILQARSEYIAWKQRELIIKLQQFTEEHGGDK
ncbi:MAG: hypothetical protein IIZ78_29155 [Clostridiales bacterium]|nr:hypothetical protein [Clostridiales bacterium]